MRTDTIDTDVTNLNYGPIDACLNVAICTVCVADSDQYVFINYSTMSNL